MNNECLGQGHRPDQFRKSENAIYFAAGFMLFVVGISYLITYCNAYKFMVVMLWILSSTIVIGSILIAIAAFYCYRIFRNLNETIMKDEEDLK